MAIKITDAEKEYLIREFAARMKDIVYITAYKRAKEQVEKLLRIDDWDSDCFNTINFNYTIQMVVGDVLQVLGRQRRHD